MVKFSFNPFTCNFDQILSLENPLQFKGEINANSDFPTSAEVKNGWFYTIGTDVTDNDATKTNTGQSFEINDEIAWNGTNWTIIGINGDDNYLKLDGSNANSNIDIGTYNFDAGVGTFGTTYQAILGDDDNTMAGYFVGGSNTVTLADGTYAINAVGLSYFNTGYGDVYLGATSDVGAAEFIAVDGGTAILGLYGGGGGGTAGYFYDGTPGNEVKLADGTYAINSSGALYLDGGSFTSDGSGNIQVASLYYAGSGIFDGSNLSIEPTNRTLYASDGSTLMLDWYVDGTLDAGDNDFSTTGTVSAGSTNTAVLGGNTYALDTVGEWNAIGFGYNDSGSFVLGAGGVSFYDGDYWLVETDGTGAGGVWWGGFIQDYGDSYIDSANSGYNLYIGDWFEALGFEQEINVDGDINATGDFTLGSYTKTSDTTLNLRTESGYDTRINFWEDAVNTGFSLVYDGGTNKFQMFANTVKVLEVDRVTGDFNFQENNITTTGLGTFYDITMTTGGEFKHYTGSEIDVGIDDVGNLNNLNGFNNKNPFGGTDMYISEVHNFLFLADKRFDVTYSNFYRYDGTSTPSTPLTDAYAALWFNGGFENASCNILNGETGVVTIDFTGKGEYNSNGIVYSSGYLYLSFYSNWNPESIAVRVKDRNGTYYNATVMKEIGNSSTSEYWRITMPGNNYMTELEISVVGSDSGSLGCTALNGIELRLTRPSTNPFAYVDKFVNQKFYKDFSWNDGSNVTTASITATTGKGIFSDLDVDTLNLNGNVISDSTGTISFDDENLATTGNIQGNFKSSDGSAGITTTFTNGDGNTVTVKDGLITDIS